MRLLLVRHPRTRAAEGICYGRSDVAVEPALTEQAAGELARVLPAGIALCSSPLARCAGLARAIAALRPELGAVAHDARLAEMDFGAWELREWAEIARGEFDDWLGDFADARPGGSGESVRTFMARVGQAFDEWRTGGRDAAWITHAGVMRAAGLLHAGVRCAERSDQWPGAPIGFGEVVTLEL